MKPDLSQNALREFPVIVPSVVRFRDIDAMGHVNNAVYLTYFESARVGYHDALAGHRSRSFKDYEFEFILAEVTCSYRSPAYLGETLQVGIRVSSVGRKSFVFEYEMRDQSTGRLVAEGRSVQVMYDHRTQRSKLVSEEFLAKVEALQGQPVRREAG
jgi:acyl-CoA thioester hydrolase